jgi:sensor histidine kinase YesM
VLVPLLTLFWVGNIAATMAQVYLQQSLAGARPSLLDLLRWVLPGYVVWLVAVPVIVLFLSRRHSFERRRWRASVTVHLLASLAIAVSTLAVDTLFAIRRQPERELVETYADLASGWLLWIVFTYWFFLAVVLAVRHAGTAAARQLRATQLEAAVANAQLAALKTQLHPHFLFNALNSVSSLVAEEPRAAQKMIARLGELLRASLADNGSGDWTLRRELELLDGYTEIEVVRFGARLKVEVDCEPEAYDARIPALLLLPLVENAILHGIQPTLRGGTVGVVVRRDGSWLSVEVSDDGVGIPDHGGAPREEGVGLSNTRQRLATRFPGEHRFEITSRAPAGTRVAIRIPWTTSPAAEASRVPAA